MKRKRAIAWDAALSAGENARLHLPPLVREFFAAGRDVVLQAGAPGELHAFRLAAKRFRYTLELLRPCYGPGLEQRIEAVRHIQNLLGKRQDCAVQAARLRKLPQASEGLRAALDRFEHRGLKLEQEFRAYWLDTFDRPGAAMAWVRYLMRRPRQPRPSDV